MATTITAIVGSVDGAGRKAAASAVPADAVLVKAGDDAGSLDAINPAMAIATKNALDDASNVAATAMARAVRA
jgi:hypothetical protein